MTDRKDTEPMFDRHCLDKARAVIERCRGDGITAATAESCTGGLVCAALTAIAGASDVVQCGYVTYSNEAKTAMLGVPAEVIADNGAVSEIVARHMAEGAIEASGVGIAVSVTGIAGPGGGSPEKPTGLVHIACARAGQPTLHQRFEFGDRGRDRVRILSVHAALDLMLHQLGQPMVA